MLDHRANHYPNLPGLAGEMKAQHREVLERLALAPIQCDGAEKINACVTTELLIKRWIEIGDEQIRGGITSTLMRVYRITAAGRAALYRGK